jgi:DNA relaxase NicK
MSITTQRPKFDWYSASLDDPAQGVVQALLDNFQAASYRPARARNGYTDAAELTFGDTLFASVQWGGNPGTYVSSTGSNAPAFAAFLRSLYPVHRVSRADIAIDYDGPGTFDYLDAKLREHAKEYNLRTSLSGDWIDGQHGRTLYLGSRSSPTFLRLYEKGKQLQLDDRPDWTRLELEVKPSNPLSKLHLASAKPAAFFGASKWSAKLATLLGSTPPERVFAGSVRVPSDDERAFLFMLKQYGPLLERLADQLPGGLPAIGSHIQAALHQLRKGTGHPSSHPDQLELFRPSDTPLDLP